MSSKPERIEAIDSWRYWTPLVVSVIMFPRSSTATTDLASSESHPCSRRVFWMDFLSAVSLIVPFLMSSTMSEERGMTSMKILLWRLGGGGGHPAPDAPPRPRGRVFLRGRAALGA